MTDFPFTADVVLLNSGETARKGMYVELGLHHEIDGPICPDDRNPFMDLDQGREKGQRFRVTFHLLADDETTTAEIADDETPKPAERPKSKRQWHELTAREQSVLRCKDGRFQSWVCGIADEEAASREVRARCGVESRSELDNPHNHQPAAKWFQIDAAFRAAEQGRTNEDLREQARSGP